jgi:hypothetical protein
MTRAWRHARKQEAQRDRVNACLAFSFEVRREEGPFGRTFVFADPDGYRITVNENPWERFPLGGRPRS